MKHLNFFHQKPTFLPKTMASFGRKRKLLFGLVAVFLLFLLLEIIARGVFYFRFNKLTTSLGIQGNSLQMNDSQLVFRNRPLYVDYHFKYQNNEEGFKSAPGETEMPVKGENEVWVFLFGASAMEGMGSNKDGEWLDITGQ